jgi:hypothetical protein
MKLLPPFVLGLIGLSFGGSYESGTKLNATEWDETSHGVYAWIDNPTASEYDKLYIYDWTLSGNSVEKAKAVYAGLLTAYTSGLPVHIFYSTQAVPTTSGWGTIGAIAAVRLGDSGPR